MKFGLVVTWLVHAVGLGACHDSGQPGASGGTEGDGGIAIAGGDGGGRVLLDGGFVVGTAPCSATAVRWASETRRAYITGPVVCTPATLGPLLPPGVLELVDAERKTWILRGSVILQAGATLQLHGDAAAGDVNQFRLLSNDDSREVVFVRADWGSVDMDSVAVTSWDEGAQGPDRRPDRHGRAYFLVRSFLDADGATVRQSRMDIRRSDVGYLGYDADEAYGLTWRVSEDSVQFLDRVDVGGDVQASAIHDNWFGIYTWGAQGMQITGNEVARNIRYGLDPHDDSDDLAITDNEVHDNGDHGIICSKRCDHLLIARNRVHANGGHGIILHLSATDSTVEENECHDNAGAGIAIVESSTNVIRGNRLYGNGRGLQVSNRSLANRIESNQITANREYGLYFFPGDDPQASAGRPMNNVIAGNTVSGNGFALNCTDADNNTFEDNTFGDNGEGILFQDARTNLMVRNTVSARAVVVTKTTQSQKASTIVTPGTAPLVVQNSGEGTTTFRDAARPAYAVAGLAEPTVVTASDSSMSLDITEASSPRAVTAVALFTDVAGGEALVTPADASGRAWTARAQAGTVAVRFRVGGLAPNADHVVLRDGVVLANVRSDGSGTIEVATSLDAAGGAFSVRQR